MQVRILPLLMLSLSGHLSILSPSFRKTATSQWLQHLRATRTLSTFFYLSYWPRPSHVTDSVPSYGNGFRVYFLKKEVFYTKLKYSRVPQFDTSAGAVASFLSGLYGFMICEKFGFELLDSGDFLFVVLYLVSAFLVGVIYVQLLNYPTSPARDFYYVARSFFAR